MKKAYCFNKFIGILYFILLLFVMNSCSKEYEVDFAEEKQNTIDPSKKIAEKKWEVLQLKEKDNGGPLVLIYHVDSTSSLVDLGTVRYDFTKGDLVYTDESGRQVSGIQWVFKNNFTEIELTDPVTREKFFFSNLKFTDSTMDFSIKTTTGYSNYLLRQVK